MIQHVVLVNFRHGVPDGTRALCVQRLRALDGLIPGLTNWRVGTNRSDLTRAWDVGITGEFADIEAMLAYRAHPAHREVQTFVDDYAAETVGIDFDPMRSDPGGDECEDTENRETTSV